MCDATTACDRRPETRIVVTLAQLDERVRAFKATCVECAHCEPWLAYAHTDDTSGCNWSVPATGPARDACQVLLRAFVNELRRTYNVADRWRSE